MAMCCHDVEECAGGKLFLSVGGFGVSRRVCFNVDIKVLEKVSALVRVSKSRVVPNLVH